MKSFRRTAGIVSLCLALGFSAAACGKKKAEVTPQPPPPPVAPPVPPPPPPPPAPPAPPAPAPLSEDELFARKSLEELNAERPLADVYFDLDGAVLREDARAPLQKDAEWMRRWTSTKISVEGHCDERGSSEYNLALGERRAVAVKEYLVSLGISGDRIMAVSKGKESPFCSDANDSCWQQNRRGHFVITGK